MWHEQVNCKKHLKLKSIVFQKYLNKVCSCQKCVPGFRQHSQIFINMHLNQATTWPAVFLRTPFHSATSTK